MNEEWNKLYEAAKSVIKPNEISSEIYVGSVGAAVLTTKGNIYTGISIDTSCSLGMCAERNAISTMFTNGEYEITKVCAVYKDGTVNFVKYKEKRVKKGEIITTEFKFITSIKVNKTNAKKIVVAGRNRWKIENQGFNRQKNWQGDIEHACSHNERVQKNHYLMEQIADFIKQLYEYFYLLKNGIKKMKKNISSELLASLATTLIAEDTNDKHSLSQN